MRSALVRLTAAVSAATLIAACARPGAQDSGDAMRIERSILTREQTADRHFNTAYDAVESLRGNWLKTRGTDSFTSPSQVRVYLDNISLGDTSTLHTIPMANVVYIRFFDGVAATARWGLDHVAGVIYVSTRPLLKTDPET